VGQERKKNMGQRKVKEKVNFLAQKLRSAEYQGEGEKRKGTLIGSMQSGKREVCKGEQQRKNEKKGRRDATWGGEQKGLISS